MLDWWAFGNEDFLCHGCPEPSVSRKRSVLGLWSELSSLHPPLPVCGSREAEMDFPDYLVTMLTGKPGQSEGSYDSCC